MDRMREIVITGIGVISPIGIDTEQFWASLDEGRSGVGRIGRFDEAGVSLPIGGEVADVPAKKHVRPRKNIKVMSRDIQMGYVAADVASADASLPEAGIDPQRLGVVFGADLIAVDLSEMVETYRNCTADGKFEFSRWGKQAMDDMFPLWMLKYLPNMPACHIGIGQDGRGPNDSLTVAEASSLAAVAEAARVIQRGQADVIIAGGTGSRLHPTIWARQKSYQMSGRLDDPAAACRPFDADRDGMVHGEGAAAFVLETRQNAEARGAKIRAHVLGFANTFEPYRQRDSVTGDAIRRAIRGALGDADLKPEDVGHVNADGLSTTNDDRIEARAIRDTLGDVPVTAPKSYFGNLSAGTGAVELVASLLAFEKGQVPATLNYQRPDPECPINVIHGRAALVTKPVALCLNRGAPGHSVAMIFAAP